jgi:hypothetical protein
LTAETIELMIQGCCAEIRQAKNPAATFGKSSATGEQHLEAQSYSQPACVVAAALSLQSFMLLRLKKESTLESHFESSKLRAWSQVVNTAFARLRLKPGPAPTACE